jgi:hypothetical protein
MSLRVDLLRDSERRYQGPVSVRFAVATAGLTVGAILFLAGAILVYRQISLSSDLKWARREWEKIKPRHEEILRTEKEVAADQAFLTELDAWAQTRINWNEVLGEFQKTVPSNVQLTRLEVRGDWEFLKAASPPPAESEAEDAKKKPEPPPIPMRMFKMEVGGRASGQLADEDVVRFANEIKTSEGLKHLFDSVKLQHLTKAAPTPGTQEADRVFEIEGIVGSRKMP